MDIKEIALRIGEKADEYADAKLQSKGEFHPDWHTVRDEYFAEALIAELAKQNGPVAFANEELDWKGWKSECVVKLTRKRQSEYGFTIPLYTLPPTAEQIANETAEACAKYVNRFLNGDGIQDEAWINENGFLMHKANFGEGHVARGSWIRIPELDREITLPEGE